MELALIAPLVLLPDVVSDQIDVLPAQWQQLLVDVLVGGHTRCDAARAESVRQKSMTRRGICQEMANMILS